MLFLYMGAFPPNIDIWQSELYQKIAAEEFLEHTIKDGYTEHCLRTLCHCYHLVIHEHGNDSWFSNHRLWVHSCWRYVCMKEASKIKFLHVLQSCDDVINHQRRLGAHCNSLFAFKEVYSRIKSDCASIVRSLLCFGPYQQYPVPIHAMDFKLLRVLDAQEVRFYYIPLEIMKLICLKYLALTCNKELPVSISNLFHLQSLIIRRHMSITKHGALSFIPVEIWGMQDLQCIMIPGRDLPTPNFDATLDKLSCLYGVSAKSCTREILKRVPNLRMLQIMLEWTPFDDEDDRGPLSGLDNISVELHNLILFDYTVMNPQMKNEFMVPLSMFPSNLVTLGLSGLGCSWKHMNDIGSLLPNLQLLHLEEYAFRGQE